jgi:flagellar biogenesis protein FliO
MMNGMEGCCGGMAIWMILFGLLGAVLLILLIVWLVKQIKK